MFIITATVINNTVEIYLHPNNTKKQLIKIMFDDPHSLTWRKIQAYKITEDKVISESYRKNIKTFLYYKKS